MSSPSDQEDKKRWYYARNDDEGPWFGGFLTRGEAIDTACDEYDNGPFFVAWAINDPVRLADWIDADRALEHAEDSLADSDRVISEFDDGAVFDVTPEQEKDLIARLERACDEWQAAHSLVFTVNTFSKMGKPELVWPAGEQTP